MTIVRPIDYTSRDFNALVTDMQALVPTLLPEWSDLSPTDFGSVLIDLFAYTGDISNYYIDRVANELFLGSATKRSSVINIAKMLNYTPIAMTPATVSLRFSTTVGSGSVTIPAGTKVSTAPSVGSNPITFETNVALVIPGNTVATPQYVGDVIATQGQTITGEILSSNASGAANQVFTLFYPNVIQGSVLITVLDANGVLITWTVTDNLLDSTASARVFSTSVDDNDVMSVLFGDNVDGAAPPSGSVITATYRVGVGAGGNVAANLLTELTQPVVNVVAVTNQQAANGGADAETIASMRQSIPKSLFALQRAVTLKDYAALATQVAGVAKAQASASVYTSVLLYVAPVGGGQPSTAAKAAVVAYLADKKLVNVSITASGPAYVNVNITATVYVLTNFYQPSVRTAVLNALQELLLFDNVDFYQSVTVSQVYHAIQGVEGVDYCTLGLVVRGDAATQAGVADVSINTGEIPQAGSLNLTMHGGVGGTP